MILCSDQRQKYFIKFSSLYVFYIASVRKLECLVLVVTATMKQAAEMKHKLSAFI